MQFQECKNSWGRAWFKKREFVSYLVLPRLIIQFYLLSLYSHIGGHANLLASAIHVTALESKRASPKADPNA